jgi:hypothetical protein
VVAWYPGEVSVVGSVQRLADGPVRDAVLKDITWGITTNERW